MSRKSSLSNSMNCAEVWRRSTACHQDSCVEVAECACGEIRVRDSKDPDGPVLVFTGPEWAAFVAGVKRNEFDL